MAQATPLPGQTSGKRGGLGEPVSRAVTGVMNQLRSELERFWPGPLALFSHMDAQILLAFLERYPSPEDTRGLGGRTDAGVSRA